MSSINDGGAAFPVSAEQSLGGYPESGLSIRDYFAAKAMQGFLAAGLPLSMAYGTVAHRAYAMADAMIEARSKK